MYLAVSSAEGHTSWIETTVLWCVCYVGNFVGSAIVAGMLYAAGSLDLPVDHALFTGAAHKAHQAAGVIFVKGILANWVVCLAVRLALRCKGRSGEDRGDDSGCFHLPLPRFRALDRQYGNLRHVSVGSRGGHRWRRTFQSLL